jgi:hypothetical protein
MFQFKGGEKAAGTITGGVMFFLLRMAFWLGVVCLLLPGTGSKSTSPDAQVDAAQAVTLASAAVSDARGFCDRQPAACKVGGKVAAALGRRAEAGARTLYEFVTGSIGGRSTAGDHRLARVDSRAAPTVMPVSTQGAGTLTASDLKAPWHAPVPMPPQRPRRIRPSV